MEGVAVVDLSGGSRHFHALGCGAGFERGIQGSGLFRDNRVVRRLVLPEPRRFDGNLIAADVQGLEGKAPILRGGVDGRDAGFDVQGGYLGTRE